MFRRKKRKILTAKLEKAEKALVYSSIQRELAETELENAVKYNKDDYTTVYLQSIYRREISIRCDCESR